MIVAKEKREEHQVVLPRSRSLIPELVRIVIAEGRQRSKQVITRVSEPGGEVFVPTHNALDTCTDRCSPIVHSRRAGVGRTRGQVAYRLSRLGLDRRLEVRRPLISLEGWARFL